MSGILPRVERGPLTYTAAEAIVGGQVIEARSASLVGVAAAGSVKHLGVARTDMQPASVTGVGTTSYGAAVIDVSVPEPEGAVEWGGVIQVTYAAAAAFGDRLKCAANGQVTPMVGTETDPRVLAGTCMEAAGVSSGAKGLMRYGY